MKIESPLLRALFSTIPESYHRELQDAVSGNPEPSFYLYRDRLDYKIVPMIPMEALDAWGRGERWLDVGKRTRAEAEGLRLAYISAHAIWRPFY